MAEIMDPFAYELLARPPPPPVFDHFPCGGAMTTIEQVDNYFRAVGVLSPHPPPPADDAPPSPAATFRLRFAVDHASEQPAPAPAYDSSAAALVNNSAATPYDADIDAILRATEQHPAERPAPDYLATTQGGRIDPAARAALVQWTIDFSRLYYLDDSPILHRAVSFVDRYLSSRPLLPLPDANDVNKSKYRLRLLAAVALHAAAKLEEEGAARDLSATDIACWCGYDTTCGDVLRAERDMVAALGYRLAGPTADTFVDHFLVVNTHRGLGKEEDLEELRRVAHRIADTSLFDYRCLRMLPSAVAAAAIFLAGLALAPSHGSGEVRRWSGEVERVTGYRPADVRDGVECMYRLMDDPGFVILPVFFADPCC
ncbi:hypothetical protein QOZ80_2BG0192210 [Eleusine coracana subsp. coracana]|nr:hypothetical protein QOZ80_2BG0192210 [Eleusine coracana subsp. coracana]